MAIEENEFLKGWLLLRNAGRRHKVGLVVDRFNIEIHTDTLLCLRYGNWLNDEVINFWMHLLQERNDSRLLEPTNKPNCCFFNTFFFQKLASDGAKDSYNYPAVRRWTSRKKVDIFSKDLVFMPVNYRKVHWALGCLDLRRRCSVFFDSLGQGGGFFHDVMRRYIGDEWADKHGGVCPFLSDWWSWDAAAGGWPPPPQAFPSHGSASIVRKICADGPQPCGSFKGPRQQHTSQIPPSTCANGQIEPSGTEPEERPQLKGRAPKQRGRGGDRPAAPPKHPQANVPLQSNGFDCGVFTCLFAECLGDERAFDFTQQDIFHMRFKMTAIIAQGALPA
eukprot:GHVT01004086.1.p1 GENE.GHVT01004086.1~~GHVT01004086.1.p1  ORF type:complete len:334 (-),score=62.00 GHVT01004086.1:460-1461(-)